MNLDPVSENARHSLTRTDVFNADNNKYNCHADRLASPRRSQSLSEVDKPRKPVIATGARRYKGSSVQRNDALLISFPSEQSNKKL
jgi:hypothetical protein